MVPILIFIFLLNSFTTTVLPAVNNNSISSDPLILGSVEYVEKINSIEKKSGNRSALSAIMNDVNLNGYELDNNVSSNVFRFHILVSSVIYKIGTIDMQTHYFRNKLNRAPASLTELIDLNKTLATNRRWKLLPIKNSSYHIQGIDGEYNLKFVSYDGFCEAVYNKKGILLNENNDPINMGTYNYAAGMSDIKAHGKFDVSPYLKWGNTPDSPQKGYAEINKGVKLALINYKKYAELVYLYRQNLFKMQQGKVL